MRRKLRTLYRVDVTKKSRKKEEYFYTRKPWATSAAKDARKRGDKARVVKVQ